jgi:hypothetical protein
MKDKKSARIGFAIAVWLVLSVVVFGSLIAVAWMSMSAKADDSADVFTDYAADGKTTISEDTSNAYPTPMGDVIRNQRAVGAISEPFSYIGPGQNPVAPGHLRDF